MDNIDYIRNRLQCAKRRYRYHKGPWAGDKNSRHSELLGLAHADVVYLTAQLNKLISNKQKV